MRHIALVMAAAAGLFAPIARADPEPLHCAGHDPARAKRELDTATEAYRTAQSSSELDTANLQSAVEGFEASCRDGEPMALAWRALALIALGKKEDAAHSLASFLREKRFQDLGDDDKKRVMDAAGVLDSSDTTIKFGVVNATANVPASIYVGDLLLGKTPLTTLVAGNHLTLTATAPDHESNSRDIDTGDLRPIALDFQLIGLAASSPPPPPPQGSSGPIFVGVGAGAAVLAGVGGAIWRANRVAVYDGICRPDTSKATGACADTLSQYHVASGIEIGGFIAAGVLAVVGATWWYLDDRATKRHARSASAACSFGGCELGVEF